MATETNEVVKATDPAGHVYYMKGKAFHRDDGPAFTFANGDELWYQDGKKHRIDGPASTTKENEIFFWKDKLHREDGPAYIYRDEASKEKNEYYYNGTQHRADGPAANKEWFRYGLKHREDGPASGTKYYLHGVEYNKTDYDRLISEGFHNMRYKNIKVDPAKSSALMEKVQKSLRSNSDFIFGGAVRDYFSGDTFNNIDVYLGNNTEETTQVFFDNLKKHGLTNRTIGTENQGQNGTYNVYYLADENGTDLVKINVIQKNTQHHDTTPFIKHNANINSLAMNKEGEITSFDTNFTPEELVKMIKKKQFVKYKDDYIDNLVKKGYKEIAIKGSKSKQETKKESKKGNKETKTMNKEQLMEKDKLGMMDHLKNDMKEAAYRTAATQLTAAVKTGILSVLTKQGQSSERVAVMSEILDTDFGKALISTMIGMGLHYVPGLNEDKRIEKLAEEFRINGMSTAMNAVMGVAMEHFMPAITSALSALPQEEAQVRVHKGEVEEEHDTEETTAGKKAVA